MAYRLSSKMLITIGRKIKKERNSQKRTQEDVAHEAGVETSYFAKVERGEANPGLEVIHAIIKTLKLKSSEVLPF